MKTAIALGTVICLGVLGPVQADIPKKQDVPRYIKQLQVSPNAKVRADAAEALGHRGAIRKADVQAAVTPLITALSKDRDANVRKNAAEALGKIVPNDRVAVQPLIEALKDKDMKVRMAAATALGMHGPDASEAIPALRLMVQEVGKEKKNKGLHKAAKMALNSIQGKKKKMK